MFSFSFVSSYFLIFVFDFFSDLLFSSILFAAAKSLQSCPTLCDPIDGSPLGSSIPEILQARILEWVAISFSSAWKWKVKLKSLSHVRLFTTPWTTAYQAPPSMGFSRQEYWSRVPLPSPSPLYTQYLIKLCVLVWLSVRLMRQPCKKWIENRNFIREL